MNRRLKVRYKYLEKNYNVKYLFISGNIVDIVVKLDDYYKLKYNAEYIFCSSFSHNSKIQLMLKNSQLDPITNFWILTSPPIELNDDWESLITPILKHFKYFNPKTFKTNYLIINLP